LKLKDAKFHFVGVGGVGMSALAELLRHMGAEVSGSDLRDNALTQHLKKIGVKVFKGHEESNLGKPDVLVYSSAVKPSNCEYKMARQLGIPVIPRAEALAEIMRFKRSIAVGGTHGKTTTTSMLAAILLHAKKDPTIAVGGRLQLIESTARLGSGPWLVAEADESDGSFRRLKPEIAVITNVDSDHLDHFGNFESICRAFRGFGESIPFYGSTVLWGDDPKIREVFDGFPKRLFYYGFSEDNHFVIRPEKEGYSLIHEGEVLGSFQLKVPGRHNVLNGVAAAIAAWQTGVSWPLCFTGLESYSGVDRRFQKIYQDESFAIYDDYAHHPTEVRATLQGVREKFKDWHIKVLFQPHRFSRTKDCWTDFMKAFKEADQTLVADVYRAGEDPIEGINGPSFAKELQSNSEYLKGSDDFLREVVKSAPRKTLFLTMGAGDIWKKGHQIKNIIEQAQP